MKKILTSFQNIINTNPGPVLPPPPTIDDVMNKKYHQIAWQKEQFASKHRYITFIATDKPIYRPAQKLFPHYQHQQRRGVRWEIISPSDALAVRTQELNLPDWGTVSDCWTIPEGLAGGNYKLRIIYDVEGFAPAEREFNIREFSNPRFKMQLEFVKKGLGPGDEATAKLNAVKADGSFLKNAKVEAVARVDGQEVHRSSQSLDEKGNLQVSFNLPREITRGEGTLSCVIDDGASVENCSKTIPIVMQTIDVRSYAEGGDLVAGLRCGLYIESFLINGDPADLTAEIIDDRNIGVGNIQTQHEGRGRTTFTPEAGRTYKLKVLAPSGIAKPMALGSVLDEGVTLSSLQNTWTADEVVRIRVSATRPAVYRVGIFKKDLEISTTYADIDRPCGEKEVAFTLPATSVADGVLRVTVSTTEGMPVAERLTFRKPAGNLKIVATTNKKRYSPGEKVTLKLRAYDALSQQPVSALLGVCVTDDSVLEMVEKRKQAPRLPVQAYFESEVDHLDDAHVYLDPSNPSADAAIDLLLGTQGWRRFAFVDAVKYIELAQQSATPAQIDLTYRRCGSKLTTTVGANGELLVTSSSDVDQLFQAANPLPSNSPLQYFEITIESMSATDPVVAVGFAHNKYALEKKLPGWEVDTIAVHSDDGCFFKDGAQVDRKWTFGAKDTVGIGFNEISKQIFFSKNGELKGTAGSVGHSDVLQYYLTVGMRGKGTSVRINAQGPYKFKPSSVFTAVNPKTLEIAERLLAVHHPVPLPENQENISLTPIISPPRRSSPDTESNNSSDIGDLDEEAPKLEEEEELRSMSVQSVPMRESEKNEKRKESQKDKLASPVRASAAPPPGRTMPMLAKSSSLSGPASPKPSAAPSPKSGARASIAPPPPPASMAPPSMSMSISQGQSSKKLRKDKASSKREDSRERPSSMSRRPVSPVSPRLPNRVIVREYVHLYKPAHNPAERVDFKETLYWNGSFETQPFSDHTISFDLSDSITSFKVFVDGVSRAGGLIGSTSELLPSTEPFYIEFKLPIEVSCGDMLQIPVSINNDTTSDLKVAFKAGTNTPAFALTGLKQSKRTDKKKKDLQRFLVDNHKTVTVAGNGGNKRILVHAGILQAFVQASLTLSAFCDPRNDLITRGMRIVPAGFPFKLSASGALKVNTDRSHSFSIPLKTEPSSVATSLKFYLNPLGSMTQALKALVREPYGCFEQTSSVAYPLVMAQQYFMSHRGVDQALIADAKSKLQKSYDRLKGFEVKTALVIPSGGFDWYGSAPANESLTAYGLHEFQDMKQVYPVEEALIARIKNWLSSRRDGKGQFLRGSGRYGFGNAPQDVTNAYILWALTENGAVTDLAKEIDFIVPLCSGAKASDPYYLGVTCLVLFNVGRTTEAHQIAATLQTLQDKATGVVCGGANPKMHDSRFTSITYSYGDGLLIEATSLAVLAWLRGGDQYAAPLESAMRWLATRCKDGAFGSTQSTIMALKAIVEYDKLRSSSGAGAITILLDGKQIAEIEINEKTPAVIDGPDIAPFIREAGGAHELKVKLEGGAPLSYSIAIDYNALQPDDDPACSVKLSTALASPQIQEGEGGEVKVSITNTDKSSGIPMVVGIIGLPGGLEPRHEQLRELVKSQKIDFYEVLGREVIVYLREMGPGQVLEFLIDVVAKIPGVYQGPASRAYLYDLIAVKYYTNESKHWNLPLQVTVLPKAN